MTRQASTPIPGAETGSDGRTAPCTYCGHPKVHHHRGRCYTDVPAFDRDAARIVVRRFVSPYLTEEDEETVIAAFEGCVQPVDGITLTRDEAALARYVVKWVLGDVRNVRQNEAQLRALVSSLEASS